MDTARALRGEAQNTPSPTTDETTLRNDIRTFAGHLQHIAALALVAAAGAMPERGVEHLVAGLEEVRPLLDALQAAVRAVT